MKIEKRGVVYLAAVCCMLSLLFSDTVFSTRLGQISGEYKNVTTQESDHFDEDTHRILTAQEMSVLFGGSATGGLCLEFYHSCPSGCTHLRALKCQGVSGNCYGTGYSGVCKCASGYIFTEACL
jgi:hypothetical protein